MSTENKVKEEVKEQVETKTEATQTEVQTQTTEVKDPMHKRIWNKVKTPLKYGAIIAGAFGLGVAADKLMSGSGSQSDEAGSDGDATSESAE